MSKSTIGAELRRLRESRRMTQAAAARAVGCDRTTVARHEGGSQVPSIDILRRYAKAYDVSLGDLLGASDAVA